MNAAATVLLLVIGVFTIVGCTGSDEGGSVTSEGHFGPLEIDLAVSPTSPTLDDSLVGRLTVVNTGAEPLSLRRLCPSSISLTPSSWNGPGLPVAGSGQPAPLDALTLALAALRSVPFEGDDCDPGEVLTLEGGDELTTEGSLDLATIGFGPGPAQVRAHIGLGAVYAFEATEAPAPIVVELPTPSTDRIPLDRALASALELPALQEWAADHDQGFEAEAATVERGWQILVHQRDVPPEQLDQVTVRVDDEGSRVDR
ncbi:hypothetical protein [Rhabdothermincola salaria]|uniref:hypothetical protein n=1 Tax=Rhabdothermincola salaria TaxID=2903142 RepID=UPI001E435763|nr:hypothetical protein [Rhabdothermincola salaria]MCD9623655.1 hypothetical protein [Rhabdothermincola salaria]